MVPARRHRRLLVAHSPFDPRDEEDQVAVDFGAVDEFVDVAGVHRLGRLQAARPDAVAHWWDKRRRR